MAFSKALGVDTEQIRNKAFDVSGDLNAMISDVQRMVDETIYTAYYWKGEAAELERNKFRDNVDEMNAIINRALTYPQRITQMAGIYESAEEYNTALAGGLKADIVMV